MNKESQEDVGDMMASSFQITFAEGIDGIFEDIEVLNSQLPSVGYRHGDSPVFYPIKMPGLGRVGKVVLKRGLFDTDAFQQLNRMCKVGTDSDSILISLCDSESMMSWVLEYSVLKTIVGPKDTADGDWTRVDELVIEVGRLIVSVPAHLK